MKIVYRIWTKDDAQIVRNILHATWLDAYAFFIPEKDLLEYLDRLYNIEKIEEDITNLKIVGIISEVDNTPAGCLRLQYNSNEQRLYVQQLYILPQYQHTGLGKGLMKHAAERAILLGLDRVWLGVMVKNELAVKWYKKMGYEIVETTPFIMGDTNVDHYIGFVPVDRILAEEKNKQDSNNKFSSSFDSQSPIGILPKKCFDLLEQQKNVWDQLADGYKELDKIKWREIDCSSFKVKLQFNQNRIASTSASTEPEAVKNRKCFLCIENLPAQQQGIRYRNEYLILCNPAPIFPYHFTVSYIRHVPQQIEKSIDIVLELAKDLSPEFTIFYNGPECGASAPDHLHFQVSPRRQIPVENDAVDMKRRKRFYYKNHLAAFTLMNYGRKVLILESSEKDILMEFIRKLFTAWKNVLNVSKEPRMNLLCSFQEQIWRLIIFPRIKHRPDIYFKDDEERVLVSPAAVDLGGLIITPREKDFIRIDEKLIKDIFSEVTEKQEVVDQIIGYLS